MVFQLQYMWRPSADAVGREASKTTYLIRLTHAIPPTHPNTLTLSIIRAPPPPLPPTPTRIPRSNSCTDQPVIYPNRRKFQRCGSSLFLAFEDMKPQDCLLV